VLVAVMVVVVVGAVVVSGEAECFVEVRHLYEAHGTRHEWIQVERKEQSHVSSLRDKIGTNEAESLRREVNGFLQGRRDTMKTKNMKKKGTKKKKQWGKVGYKFTWEGWLCWDRLGPLLWARSVHARDKRDRERERECVCVWVHVWEEEEEETER
jgi:hypothetical protein